MFIDYVTLMLINMTAGLVVLAAFLLWGLTAENRAPWAPVFGITGLIAATCGFAMTFSAPLPEPFNMAFGEMSVLLGMLFLAASWSLAKGWPLLPLGIYAFFAGLAAVLLGIRIIDLDLTLKPALSGAGFILTGLSGILAIAALWKRHSLTGRLCGAAILLAAAAIWLLTALAAYWSHMAPTP